jgi:hypothetical protein
MAKEIGLLFTPENRDLVRRGLKTQTRRHGKTLSDPTRATRAIFHKEYGYWIWFDDEEVRWRWMDDRGDILDGLFCPYGHPQYAPVRYYMKEPVQVTAIRENIDNIEANVLYLDDGRHCTLNITPGDYAKLCARSKGWHAPTTAMFMLKSFARTWLNGVRTWPERLGDMSAEDAIAEGIELDPSLILDTYWPHHWRDYLSGGYDLTPVQSYASLWDSINGEGSWQPDKWTWCVEWEKPSDRL